LNDDSSVEATRELRREIEASAAGAARWVSLTRDYGSNVLATMHRYGVLTLTPDFVSQGLLRRLEPWLDGWKSVVAAAVPRVFTPADVAALYAGRVSHDSGASRARTAWLAPQLFAQGPSVVLVLRSEHADPPLQVRIRETKGRSAFGERSEGQLRGMAKFVDRYLSLVHAPDDYESVFHELELVFGAAGASRALHVERPAIHAAALKALLSTESPSADAHPGELALHWIIRGLARLAADPRVRHQTEFGEALGWIAPLRAELRKLPCNERSFARVTELFSDAATRLESTLLAERSHAESDARNSTSWRPMTEAYACADLCVHLGALLDAREWSPRLASWDLHRLEVLMALHGGVSDTLSHGRGPSHSDEHSRFA
jgi:hypothetical protein